MKRQSTLACEEKAQSPKQCCPLLTAGGVRCNHQATIVPQEWELPPYCVPGMAVCSCCYQALRKHAAYSQSLRYSLW